MEYMGVESDFEVGGLDALQCVVHYLFPVSAWGKVASGLGW